MKTYYTFSRIVVLLGIVSGLNLPVVAETKIGVIIPLSGDAADLGKGCQNGIELARREQPSVAEQFRIIYEDDGNIAKNTVTAFTKLVAQNDVDALIVWSSGTSNAVAPLADQKRVPLIAIASDPNVVRGRSHVVNLWVTPEAEIRELNRELERRDIRHIARISTVQDGVLAIRDAFNRMNSGRVTIDLDEEYATETKDFRPFLVKLKAKPNIQAVHVNLYFGQVGLFAKQARELGISLPLFGIETFEDKNQVEISRGALVGQWYIQAGEPSGQFIRRYESGFPGASFITAANCYDALLLLAKANANGDRDTLNRYLHTVRDFSGALGVYSATGENTFTLPAIAKVVTKDGFELLRAQGEGTARETMSLQVKDR